MANLTNEKAEFAIAIIRHFSPLFAIAPPPPPEIGQMGFFYGKASDRDLDGWYPSTVLAKREKRKLRAARGSGITATTGTLLIHHTERQYQV